MSDEELLKLAAKDLNFILDIELPEPKLIIQRSIAASLLVIARNSVSFEVTSVQDVSRFEGRMPEEIET